MFQDNLRKLRVDADLTQEQLAERLGTAKSTISMYENGNRQPDFETLEAIADFFNVDIDYLMGRSHIKNKYQTTAIPKGFDPPPEMVPKPLVGKIACGAPILAEQNITEYLNVPKDIRCDFLLTCDGDSMLDAGIQSGDIVYLVKHPDIDYNGQIAAVRIDDEATLKKVFKYNDKVILQPANANYEPLVYVKEEINSLIIEGVATGFTHKFALRNK